jgi:sec-independent protein translocase protein TatB
MFDLGPDKLVLIFAAVLIFLGPKEIPAAVRQIGKWRRQLRSFQDTIRSEITSMIELPRDKPSPPPE